jgi:hypothetical protein
VAHAGVPTFDIRWQNHGWQAEHSLRKQRAMHPLSVALKTPAGTPWPIFLLALGAAACSSTVAVDDTAVEPETDAGHVAADVTVQPDGTSEADAPTHVGDEVAPDAPTAYYDAPSEPPPDALLDALLDQESSSTSCDIVDTSTLPHVHVQFPAPVCVFTVAQAQAGITIPYDVVVDEDVPGFAPAPYPYPYSVRDVANLALTAVLSGGGQSYCVCDEGLPLPSCPVGDGGYTPAYGSLSTDACAPVTIPHGTYSMTFTWDGRNWNGPSDTANEEGRLFPAGDYQLAVSTAPGSVGDAGGAQATGKMTIHLLP